MQMKPLISLALVLAMTVAADGKITVKVTDSDKAPLAGAVVTVDRSQKAQDITVKFADMDYDGSIGGHAKLAAWKYYLRNLSTHQDMGRFTDGFSCNNIPVLGSVMIKVTPEKLYKSGETHKVAAIPASSTSTTPPQAAEAGKDFITAQGLFSGMEGCALAPEGKVTRAMFVTALSRIDGERFDEYIATSTGLPFDDVSYTDWYGAAAGWAAHYNILTCGCGAFEPRTPVTREAMAVAICRYLESRHYSLGLRAGLVTYADEDRIMAYRDVKSLQATGIMGGDKSNHFNPEKNVTQAEVVETFVRLIEVLK